MGPNLLPYVREQGIQNSKIPATPPRFWLNFIATTGRRARFIIGHENHGKVLAERTEDRRFFDLRPTPVFAALSDRLVIEWTKDAVNWAKTGDQATSMTVVEISDPSSVPFPGFDSLLVSFEELQAVIADDRYGQWRTALSSVQGIYLIADARHRQHFQFSILQVFSPSAPSAQVDAAEAHFKRALLTRQVGMNLN